MNKVPYDSRRVFKDVKNIGRVALPINPERVPAQDAFRAYANFGEEARRNILEQRGESYYNPRVRIAKMVPRRSHSE